MRPLKILVIGTSGNRNSINLALATAAANMIDSGEVETLSVADYELPLFNDERGRLLGQPSLAREFVGRIGNADAIVLSFAEYNGTYTASFKNIFDWASRIEKQVFQHKPAIFLSTSEGPGGARSVLRQALQSAEFYGARVIGSLSVPCFSENFDRQRGRLSNESLHNSLSTIVQRLRSELVGHAPVGAAVRSKPTEEEYDESLV